MTGHPARKAADWEALVAELRALQDSSWAGLRDSIAINETRAFARKLQTLSWLEANAVRWRHTPTR